MVKRICSNCGNKKKRQMKYVELWGESSSNPEYFGYKCLLCGYFWEVYVVNTKEI